MKKKCLILGIFCLICFLAATPASAENYKNIGLGLGISNSNPFVELNFRPLDLRPKTKIVKPLPIEFSNKYYISGGYELTLKIYVVDKKYIRWHFLDPGAYFLAKGNPLTVRDVTAARSVDITFGTGFDILPWKNLCISLSVHWFLPDFRAAYAAGAEAALDYTVNNFKVDPGKSIEDIVLENGEAAFRVAAKRTEDIYFQALKEPHFQLTLTWYFF